MTDDRTEEIAGEIDSLAELLREISYDRLREAVAEGATTKPASLKPMAQAIRSLEKAARSLRRAEVGG